MCAIGRNLDTSVGANSPATTMLGSSAIGGSTAPGARRVAGGTAVGTLLTGGSVSSAPPNVGKPGGGSTSLNKTQMQR
jgi:hypothetical protein